MRNVTAAAEKAKTMVSEEVGAGDIAEVVSASTGIPVGKMLPAESRSCSTWRTTSASD